MAAIGYTRVSAREERRVLDGHIEALTAAGCEQVFDDYGPIINAHRPGLRACLGALRHGDVLVVRQLHHLGHQIEELIRFVDELEGVALDFVRSIRSSTRRPRLAALSWRSMPRSPKWSAT